MAAVTEKDEKQPAKAEKPSHSVVEKICSLLLALSSAFLCARFSDPVRSLGVSILVTVAAHLVVSGWQRALDEVKGIACDAVDLCKYLVSLGHWPSLGDERPLVHANQFISVINCYAWSYGIYSLTLKLPIENTWKVAVFWYENPDLTPELLELIFFKVVPVGVLSCTFAHLASHRYFSHKSYKTSRPFQCVLSLLSAFSSQRGALWWSSTHRRHHRTCGSDNDPHGSKSGGGGVLGFLYSHIGWTLNRHHFPIEFKGVEEWWTSYPELLVLEALYPIFNLLWRQLLTTTLGLSAATLGLGYSLHFEGLVNSYCHTAEHTGETHTCDSLDSFFTAIITGGEGFHYGHHKDPLCACHGWRWGMLRYFDLTYTTLCVLEKLGLVWDVRHPKLADSESQKQK